jgi:hypothetical protein
MSSLALTTSRLPRMAARTAIVAIGAAGAATVVGCGLRIARAATVDPTFLVPSGRRTGYPSWMRGPLGLHAGDISLHAFLLLVGAMVVGWLAVVVASRQLPAWFLWLTVACAVAVFALAPPLLSTDVFNYIAYGLMGTHGVNPYLHGPITLIGQPVYGYTGHLWKNVPSAYGPLFTLLSYALAPLGVAAAYWWFKAIAAASLVALAVFAWLTARALGRDPRMALALVALNPLVLLYALGGAHNDLLMAVPLAAAVYLAVTRRAASAGAACVVAIAIKASAGLALPFVLLGARPRRRAVAGALAAAIVIVAATLFAFGDAIKKMPQALTAQQHFHWIVVSVPSFIGHYAHLGVPNHGGRIALTLLSAVVIVGAVVYAWRDREWLDAAGLAVLAVLFTTAWVLPWYVVWALPLVVLARRPAVPALAILLTVLLTAMQLDHFALTRRSHHPPVHRSTVARSPVSCGSKAASGPRCGISVPTSAPRPSAIAQAPNATE